jgi:hypothetical protein
MTGKFLTPTRKAYICHSKDSGKWFIGLWNGDGIDWLFGYTTFADALAVLPGVWRR